MLNTLSKPRWLSWEKMCLMAAFEEKIQLKIIAWALEKSVTAINKKIKALGLRGTHLRPGRLKGDSYNSDWGTRTSVELAKMTDILKQYAPLHHSHQEKLSEQRGFWATPLPSSKKLINGACFGRTSQKEAPYSLGVPLLHEGLQEIPSGIQKSSDQSLYISLCHVEEWAFSTGFQPVKSLLRSQGISYWKGGKYFSTTQLLIYLNGIRLEKKLEPLRLDEEK